MSSQFSQDEDTLTTTSPAEKDSLGTARKRNWTLISLTLLVPMIVLPWLFTGGAAIMDSLRPALAEEIPDVETVKPVKQELFRRIELSGELKAYQEAALYAKTAGYLEWIKVDKGDTVEAGQVIAKIFSPELGQQVQQAQAEYQAALAEFNQVPHQLLQIQAEREKLQSEATFEKLTYERYRAIQSTEPDLIAAQDVDATKSRYLSAENHVRAFDARLQGLEIKASELKAKVMATQAKANQFQSLAKYTNITAPFSGTITNRHVDPGDFIAEAVTGGQAKPIVSLKNSDRLRLQVSIPDTDVSFVKPGNRVEVKVNALPDQRFTGTVTRIASSLDPGTRTMLVEIELENPDHKLLPGMYAITTVNLEKHPQAVTLPVEAINSSKKGTYVLAVSDKTIQKIPVVTGITDGKMVEITQGLKGSETIVVSNQSDLKEGMIVNAVKARTAR
jgi:membrane fusion protein, multidrug efflux system